MKNKLLLKVKGLDCKRNGSSIFKPISFSLFTRSIVVIRGSNGSGKTSLLHSIAGLISYSGNIDFKINNKTIGYVGHKLALKENDTVIEFIKYWKELYGSKKDLNKIIEQFKVRNLLYTPISFLSFGQKKRLAFIRLRMIETKLWLLDEPFSGMDNFNKKLLLNIMNDHLLNKGGIIMATHESFRLLNIKYKKEVKIV